MEIRFKMITEFGEYCSEVMYVTYEQYLEIVELSKLFWINNSSYDMWADYGLIIFPPEILRKSILIIETLKDDECKE